MSQPTEGSVSSRISDVHCDLGNALDSLETLIRLLEAEAEREGVEGFSAGLVQLLKSPRGIVDKAFNDLDVISTDALSHELHGSRAEEVR